VASNGGKIVGMVNWKGCGRKRQWTILRLHGGTKENHEPISKVSAPVFEPGTSGIRSGRVTTQPQFQWKDICELQLIWIMQSGSQNHCERQM
jgi:hypothetical protein